MASLPRLIIAGAGSGVGKTSVSIALLRAFQKRGLRAGAFKIGPDFLDPTYLKIASGYDCYNLDTWMTGRDYVRNLFVKTSADADIALIEGAMGFYDGARSSDSEGSAAEMARLLSAPVLLITNAKGMARSLAAVVKGFCELEADSNIAGVIANHVGSEKHGEWIAESLRSCSLPPLLGAIPNDAFPPLPSRHLGLVTANEEALTQTMLDDMANVVERYCDVGRIIAMAKNAPELPTPVAPAISPAPDLRLGVAYDEAFHFYYRDNIDALEKSGCEIVYFSPLRDARLPDNLNGIYLGGGYPEVYAEKLSRNDAMKNDIKNFAEAGGAVYAECGGLIYLSHGVETVDGEKYEFVGLLPAWTRMGKRFRALGYYEVRQLEDTFFGNADAVVRGHKFHYSDLVTDPADGATGWRKVYEITRPRTGETEFEGFSYKKTLASYVHVHFASNPAAVKSFTQNLRY